MKVLFQFTSSFLFGATFVSLFAQNPSSIGFDAATRQLKNMLPAEGLGVQLFASEPMVLNPTSLDIDPKGRVWVTEGVNYRQWQSWGKLRPEGDRILILEDINQDGKADKSTVFYQGNDINASQGICVVDNKIVVSCSPNIIIFTDTDGDDIADKKETLFSGIGGIDDDRGIHGPALGPDGKLYFTYGSRGLKISHANGSPVTDVVGRSVAVEDSPYRGGLAFRCRLDASEFEVIGHNFRNPFELAIDSFGAIWQGDQSNPGVPSSRINEIFISGNYGYQDEITGEDSQRESLNETKGIPRKYWHQNDPGVIPSIINLESGTPKGITVYEGTSFPFPFQNQIIYCDSHDKAIRVLRREQDGAGYKAATQDLLSSNSPWFRPYDIATAPDGSLMIADWNDRLSNENQMADRQLNLMSGRIYRLAPIESSNYTVLSSSLISAKDAAQALKSPNASTRYSAWKRLDFLGSKATPELLSIWRSNTPQFRARALHLLSHISDDSNLFLTEAINDENALIRATAIRIARDQTTQSIKFIKACIDDPSPLVRRECAIALRHSTSKQVPSLWARLAIQYDRSDRWYLEALGIGAQGNEDSCFEAWMTLVGDDLNTSSGRDIVWRIRSKFSPEKLVAFIKDPKIPETEKSRYRRALDFFVGPEKDAALLQLLDQ